MCVPAGSIYGLPGFPHLFSTCEEAHGGNNHIYVPMSVVFPIALLNKHGTLKPLFSSSVEVGSGHSAELKAASIMILAITRYSLF